MKYFRPFTTEQYAMDFFGIYKWSSITAILKDFRHLGVPEILSLGLGGQIYFHNHIKTLFAFFTMLTFALMSQKQWWVKML